jgi:hypothetical protein
MVNFGGKIMTFKTVLPVAAAALTAMATSAQALVIPVGPQNDVAIATVTGDWGWTLCDSRTYSVGNAGGFSSLDQSCSGFDQIMLAGRETGSDILDVLAATNLIDATTDTGAANNNLVTTSNGADWYYNTDYSWGFAGVGDVISKTQCDTAGRDERDRLCWHTLASNVGGYRSGDNLSLNGSTSFEKLVFVGNANGGPIDPPIDVSEPGTLGLLGAGLMGLGLAWRRRKA